MTSSYGTPENQNDYFRVNGISKFLRFLNLMEPGRNVISLSKLYFFVNMWVMFFAIVFLLLVDRKLIVAVMAQGASTTLSMLNYMYRRHVLNENGHFTAGGDETDEEDEATTDPKTPVKK